MEKVLILLLISLAVAYAVPNPQGLIINLENGELLSCERELTCERDRSIVGTITNTNFGVCLDIRCSKE
uniref:Colipase C-terminal domain-containing protein n=1 Tax=Vombatus ursinus TaxID=29139 RepID=A0A4X2LB23_VOMUR